ncbi:hypothetical protein EXS54_00335 [Patescibacteria group bacterium]|nr:hypothetical protein [Patescibacteria group bacterium]
MDSIFLQLGVVIIASAALGLVARLLHQPIVLAYILAGVLIGAGGFNLIPDTVQTQDIATIGIIFLLFLIGLELDVRQVKKVGLVSLMAGVIQMLVVAGGAVAVTLLLGYSIETAIILGLAASFSSTAVVMKRLIDRHELASLHGKVSVGILLLQDVVAILALIILSGVGQGSLELSVVGLFLIKGLLFLAGTWLVTKYLLGRVFFHIAKSTELLFLASVAWAFLFAIISEYLGFSKEIGAFVAGLSLATLPYSLEIIGRVKPLKDFFLVIFFVVIGLEVSWSVIGHNLWLILALAVLVLFVKTFVTSAIMVRFGYPKRPSYLTGAGLGQMSEFSLLVVLLAASLHQVDEVVVPIAAALLALTIILNTYWLELNRFVYPVLSKPLKWIAGSVNRKEFHQKVPDMSDHILVFGANRMGASILASLEKQGRDIVVVDHNPEVIRRLQRHGVNSVYGDLDDYELLEEVGLDSARTVISTVPNKTASLYLIKYLEKNNPKALVVTTAEQVDAALALYEAGSDYVIVPHLLGGEHAAQILEGVDVHLDRSLRKKRQTHIRNLKARKAELAN